jgi:hypothetical protein
MNMTGLLAAIVSALVVLTVYLAGRKLLEKYTGEKNLADAAALVSAFMVFSVPYIFLTSTAAIFTIS